MSKLSAKIKEDVVALIPPTIFFLFTLSLIALIRVLMLRGTGIPASSMVQIAVAALILGKAVVIADLLPFITATLSDRLPTISHGRRRYTRWSRC